VVYTGKEFTMEGSLLGVGDATDKTRHYQLRTFRLVDVFKVVSSLFMLLLPS